MYGLIKMHNINSAIKELSSRKETRPDLIHTVKYLDNHFIINSVPLNLYADNIMNKASGVYKIPIEWGII